MTMTRDEFVALLAKNTAANKATIDEVFAGCNAKIYFKDEILKMPTINVPTVNSLLKANFFSGVTAEQTICITGQSYTEIYKKLDTGMFTGCPAKITDKDGNVLTYDDAKKAVTVTNPANEVVAIYYYGACNADDLAALNLGSHAKLDLVYLSDIGFENLVTLEGTATEMAAFKGCVARVVDKAGYELTFDPATGLIKTLTVQVSYKTPSGLSIGGVSYTLDVTNINFTNIRAGVTITIKGLTYVDMLTNEGTLAAKCAGCQATIYDDEGNRIVLAADGKIDKVYAAGNDTTPIYPAP
jgi:hypothetical protein